MNNKEQRYMNDLNHKISRQIITFAQNHHCLIAMEDLKYIRKTTRLSRSFRYFLNSWQFYKLKQFVEYKSQAAGINFVLIDPHFTSKDCSRCDRRGKRDHKDFYCPHCKHHDHADANAGFTPGEI